MSTEVLMPLMGEGVNEATVITWLKKPGEKVEKDEPLLEVSTDKVDTEIPSPADGFLLATHATEGDVIEVDQIIAHIGASADEKVPEIKSAKAASSKPGASAASAAQPGSPSNSFSKIPSSGGFASPVPMETAGAVRSSPLVRNMARDHGIDLRLVRGTGLHGRITKEDLERFMSGADSSRIPVIAGSGEATVVQSAFSPDDQIFKQKTTVKDGVEMLEGVEVERTTMPKMRKTIAEHMLRSVRVSPHVTTTIEIDLTNVVKYRAANQEQFVKENGYKLTFTPFFIEAAIDGIKKEPMLNCSVDGYDVLMKKDINIGCAVAIEDGLIVPVIKKSQEMNLAQLSGSLNDLAARARSKKLQPAEVAGGTFSITNPGMFGCLSSAPIINQPQVAIMSVGAIVKRPVVLDNDEIAVRSMVIVGITFDHRVVDGEGGARFLANVKKFLEGYGK